MSKNFNFVNMSCKTHLGFFLTTGAKSEDTAIEYEIAEKAVETAIKKLYEQKIRGVNVLSNLNAIGCIIDEIALDMEQDGKDKKFEDAHGNWHVFASMIVMACIANYSAKVNNFKKKNDKGDKSE